MMPEPAATARSKAGGIASSKSGAAPAESATKSKDPSRQQKSKSRGQRARIDSQKARQGRVSDAGEPVLQMESVGSPSVTDEKAGVDSYFTGLLPPTGEEATIPNTRKIDDSGDAHGPDAHIESGHGGEQALEENAKANSQQDGDVAEEEAHSRRRVQIEQVSGTEEREQADTEEDGEGDDVGDEDTEDDDQEDATEPPESSGEAEVAEDADDGGDDENEEDEEEEDEEEDDDEEEEEDDDEEPRLKYQRLASTLGETLQKDAVSTMAVSDRFLALGTHWGVVHILDLIGTDVKRFNCHAATVNALSIDTAGEFVASASDDGKVIINSLYTSEVLPFNYKRPVKAVCLEPDYSKKSTRQFVSGGMAEFLLMSGKGWFGTKDVVISSGEGPIYAVQWRGNFIAWANEAGVKIYDVSTQQKFAYVDRPPNSPRADLYRCNLVWKSDVDLMIGWADSVKLCTVKERSKMDIASGLPSRYVEITCQFRTDFIVCGIAPLADEIVLLSYLTDLPDSKNVDMVPETPMKRVRAKPPEIHIVTATGEAVGNDVLSLLGFEHYRANDYRLEYLPSDKKSDHTFYVVSPKDIVVAKPRDLEDHIEWLVERKKYEAALKAADEAGPAYEGRLQVNSIVEIGKLYLKELVDSGRFEDAAAIMPKILRDNAALWEEWVHIFHDKGQLMILYPCIPTSEPRLDPGVYMIVLLHLLETNPDLLLTTLQEWSPELYHVSELAERVERIRNKSTLIQEICMLLHTWDKHFDRALYYALILHLPTALELVARHNLYTWVQDHAVLIMDYDDWFVHHDPDVKTQIEKAVAEENATLMNTPLLGPGLGYVGGDIEVARARAAVDRSGVQILVGFPDRIMQSRVIQQLQSHRRYLHIFLDALFKQDAQLGEQYHPAQVELYAEFDYPRLIDFLRLSPAYNVGIAYEICQKRDLVPEMVFLLGKMGDNRRALMLIIERLGDVKRAIEFAKDQNDEELWEDLLHYAMDKPAFIVGMLENLSSYINPIRLVERIPNGLQIEGLKSALLKILGDCSIHMSLREGCEKILVSDTIELLETLYRAQRRALVFQDDVICSMCNIQIEQEADAPDAHLVVFFCRHTFHEECVSSTGGTPIKGGAISEKGKNPKSVIRAGPLQAGIPSESDLSPELEASTRRIYQRPALFYTSMNGIGLGGTGGVIPTVTLDRFGARVITLGSSSRPRRPKPVGLVCPICRSSKIKHHHGRRMSTDVANTTKDLAISENPLITATASSSPLPKPIVSTSSRLRHILTHA